MIIMKRLGSAAGKSWPCFIVAFVGGLWVYSRVNTNFLLGQRAGVNLWDFLSEMALILPPMFLLIGLFDVWVPRKLIERYTGQLSGIRAIPLMVLLATVQAGPLYSAFPVALGLWKKGCAPRNVFIYLGAFSAFKIPMLTFEVAFLGWSFSMARTIITLPVFILLSLWMERLIPFGYEPPGLAILAESESTNLQCASIKEKRA